MCDHELGVRAEPMSQAMADQKLNESIARKLGWKDLRWVRPEGLRDELVGQREKSPPYGETIPDYCNSIEAAWEIVENIAKNNYSCHVSIYADGDVLIRVHDEEFPSVYCKAPTVPRAICKAFLKLP